MTQSEASPAFECKAEIAAAAPLAQALDDLFRVFEAFKETNDERLAQIERRMAADVVTSEKLDRINVALDAHKRALDALTLEAGRPARSGGSSGARPGAGESKAAFEGYMRRGEVAALRGLEEKAWSLDPASDGALTVPPEVETTIMTALRQVSPMRAISAQRQVSGAVYRKPFATTGAAVGWVGETASRTETAAPALAELTFPTMELYAMPAATQALLDDSAVDIEDWLAGEVRLAFAEQENAAFTAGDGVARPRGFLNYPTVAQSAWRWGRIGYVGSGAAGAFAPGKAADALIDLAYALKTPYRTNAHWVMNRAAQAEVRKLKDGDGAYLWRPGQEAGAEATLMGFPIAEVEEMPSIAPDAFALAFGDFKRGYLVVDRMGVGVLRDPYSAKPYVLFYTTRRVGGGVQDFDAIKLLRFSAS